MPDPTSTTLAAWVSSLQWQDVPEPVRHAARRSLLNYFAVATAGSADPTVRIARETLAPLAGPVRETALVGLAERTDMLTAATLNAMAANVHDFDDTHFPTIIHPTAVVAPVVAALAGSRPLAGDDALLALTIGIEVACGIGNAISPWHYDRGWHITATCGIFGAAACAARLRGLDVERTAWALGSASAQAGGLVETLGSSAKSIGVGHAARNGLLSALLAENGFEGPARPLDGPRGFLRVFGQAPELGAVHAAARGDWQLPKNIHKPYPCGVVLNPVIDACLDLRRAHGQRIAEPQAIARIELLGHPLLRQRTDRPGVRSGRESQVSAQHAVAVALRTGRAGLAEFADDAVRDPPTRALAAKVGCVDDPDSAIDAVRVRVVCTDGRVIEHRTCGGRGTPGKPLTDAEIEHKLRECIRCAGVPLDPEPIIRAVWHMDGTADARSVFEAASPPLPSTDTDSTGHRHP